MTNFKDFVKRKIMSEQQRPAPDIGERQNNFQVNLLQYKRNSDNYSAVSKNLPITSVDYQKN